MKKNKKAKVNKYATHIAPNLDAISAYARAGYSGEAIAKILGVAYSTFRNYTKTHRELKDALRNSNDLANKEVENAAFLASTGRVVTLKKPFKIRRRQYDNTTGKLISEEEVIEYADQEEFIPPTPTAFMYWLGNRDPERWKYQNKLAAEDNNTGKDIVIKRGTSAD